MQQEVLLHLSGVSKSYAHKSEAKALKEVTLSLPRGQFVSVIGASGAGKSTLLRCINRLVDPTEGSIVFNGADITTLGKKQLRAVRRRISMVFQHYNLVYRMTSIENVLQGRLGYKSNFSGMLGLYAEEEKERAFSVLKQLGLEEFAYTRTDQLSGGQKQRVGIARALLQDPLLLLADEPIASLDPKSARTIMEQLRWAVDSLNITCVVNLHQVEYALEFSDRVVGLRDGQVVFDGPPQELNEATIAYIYGTDVPQISPVIPSGFSDAVEAEMPVSVGAA